MGNNVRTVLLLGLMNGLLLAIGQWLGGQSGLVMAFVLAVLMNFGSYWFSDKIVLRMYRAQEVGRDHPLARIVARLVQRAGMPMPRVYVIPDMSPNAFATGRNPQHAAVAATEGILRLLSEDEIEGVLAHELAHVRHRDILISSVAATIAATIMMVARMAQSAALFGGGRDDHRLQHAPADRGARAGAVERSLRTAGAPPHSGDGTWQSPGPLRTGRLPMRPPLSV